MNVQKIEEIILQTLGDLIESLSLKGPDGNKINSDTVLFGNKGILDSMALVSLITDLEEKIEKEFDVPITLADERAMSEKRSPFRTVASLAEYISRLIER